MSEGEGPATGIAPAQAKKSREPAIDRDVRGKILRAIRRTKNRTAEVNKANYKQYISDNEENVLNIVKDKLGFAYSKKKIIKAVEKALEEEQQFACNLQ